MLLRSSVKGTIGHVADIVLLGRDSNRDPDRYRENSIHDSNNDNSFFFFKYNFFIFHITTTIYNIVKLKYT